MVLDIEQGKFKPDQTIIIEGERIQRILPVLPAPIPDNTELIDGNGLYVIPGLIDAHVHYFDLATFGQMMIAHGILAVRDMGNMNEQVLPTRDGLNQGNLLGPEMVVVGNILDGNPPNIPPISVICKTPEEGRAAVRQQIEAGVNQVKVYSRLEKDVYLAILDEAHKKGYKVAGHVPEGVYIEEAVEAGQDCLEHLFGFEKVIGKLLDGPITLATGGMIPDSHYWPRLPEVQREFSAVLKRICDLGAIFCPTNVTFRNMSRRGELEAGTHPMSEYMTPLVRGMWASLWPASPTETEHLALIWPYMLQATRLLYEAGARLIVGTDLLVPGVIPGYSVHEEMELWQEAGVPPADILRSATLIPAQFLGLGERMGSIEVGKIASMVLLRGNPLEDIRNTQKIQGVFQRGKFFSRADLDQFLAEVKELAQE
jgi:imidazolonepropionase-like amidohydrolase